MGEEAAAHPVSHDGAKEHATEETASGDAAVEGTPPEDSAPATEAVSDPVEHGADAESPADEAHAAPTELAEHAAVEHGDQETGEAAATTDATEEHHHAQAEAAAGDAPAPAEDAVPVGAVNESHEVPQEVGVVQQRPMLHNMTITTH